MDDPNPDTDTEPAPPITQSQSSSTSPPPQSELHSPGESSGSPALSPVEQEDEARRAAPSRAFAISPSTTKRNRDSTNDAIATVISKAAAEVNGHKNDNSGSGCANRNHGDDMDQGQGQGQGQLGEKREIDKKNGDQSSEIGTDKNASQNMSDGSGDSDKNEGESKKTKATFKPSSSELNESHKKPIDKHRPDVKVEANLNANEKAKVLARENNSHAQHRIEELHDLGDDEYTKFVRSLLEPASASGSKDSHIGVSATSHAMIKNTNSFSAKKTQMGGSSTGIFGRRTNLINKSNKGQMDLIGAGIGIGRGGSISTQNADGKEGKNDGPSINDTTDDTSDGEEDEEDYTLEDDMDDEREETSSQSIGAQSPLPVGTDERMDLDLDLDLDLDADIFLDPISLEEELGGLLEEDMEAAVNSLIQHADTNSFSASDLSIQDGGSGLHAPSSAASTPSSLHSATVATSAAPTASSAPASAQSASKTTPNASTITITSQNKANTPSATPSKSATQAASTANAFPTPDHSQVVQLQKLMNMHYQILLQQAVLAVRAAHGNKYKGGSASGGGANAAYNRYGGGATNVGTGKGKRKRVENFFCCGETADDLAGILDGAVTMLQDLDKNRKDAIRYGIQMRRARAKRSHGTASGIRNGNGNGDVETGTDTGKETADNEMSKMHGFYPPKPPSAARAILEDEDESEEEQQGILTRSAFSKTLKENDWVMDQNANAKSDVPAHGFGVAHGNANEQHPENSNSVLGANTTFGVRGLARLDETFAAIDNSLSAQSATADCRGNARNMPPRPRPRQGQGQRNNRFSRPLPIVKRLQDVDNIFLEPHHGRACEMLLSHARADYDQNLIPGYREMSYLLTYPSEIMGKEEGMPMSDAQQRNLRQNRLQFSAAEDNLLLRGVNLYGEKEWMFISDRFLPDRSVSIIAQRYWRLCLLIYRGHGIYIDQTGNFQQPPNQPNGIDDFDEAAISRTLKPVERPIVFGLYRWSMEEDILLLKAVPLMGRMFAEIGKRFIPYRDRGALRKRYQVLERRVKGAMKRDKKLFVDPKTRRLGKIIQSLKNPPASAMSKKGPSRTTQSTSPPNGVLSSNYGKTVNKKAATQAYNAPSSGPFYARGSVSSHNANANRGGEIPPAMVTHAPYLPNATTDSYSRTALEKVIDGEWSQMSSNIRMNKIIENDVSFSQPLPRPPNPAPSYHVQQFLPSMDFDNSISGLSMLGNSTLGDQSKDGQNDGDSSARKGESIMKSVFKRSNESASYQSRKRDLGQDKSSYQAKPVTHPVKSKKGGGHDDVVYQKSRVLPPTTNHQINSNLNFSQFGGGITMSQNFDHSLMAPPELDAASVLNQMSNSSVGFAGRSNFEPPLSPFAPPRSASIERSLKRSGDAIRQGGQKSQKKSLFQKVVGDKKK